MDDLYEQDDLTLERRIYALFKLDTNIKSMIAREIPVGGSAVASVFLTNNQLLFCFIDAETRLRFGDIKKIIRHMKLVPEQYLAPGADLEYFDRLAEDKFRQMFPGRPIIGSDDLSYYRTLAPYCPALIQIKQVDGDHIWQYDRTAVGEWRPSIKFIYRRLPTS